MKCQIRVQQKRWLNPASGRYRSRFRIVDPTIRSLTRQVGLLALVYPNPFTTFPRLVYDPAH